MAFEPLIIVFMAALFPMDQEAKEEFITICKASPISMRIDCMDSRHGISKVDSFVAGDTLSLKVYVSMSKRPQMKEVKFSKEVNFVKIGSKVYKIGDLVNCKPVHSGKEALEQLKKLNH